VLNETLSKELIDEFLGLFEIVHTEVENVFFLKEASDF
jgi:hypothetical protein